MPVPTITPTPVADEAAKQTALTENQKANWFMWEAWSKRLKQSVIACLVATTAAMTAVTSVSTKQLLTTEVSANNLKVELAYTAAPVDYVVQPDGLQITVRIPALTGENQGYASARVHVADAAKEWYSGYVDTTAIAENTDLSITIPNNKLPDFSDKRLIRAYLTLWAKDVNGNTVPLSLAGNRYWRP
jgi:hypothetical protein